MRLAIRKWAIIARPFADDPVCVEAATTWNSIYDGNSLNRYFSRESALGDVAEHLRVWTPWLTFEVVNRRKS